MTQAVGSGFRPADKAARSSVYTKADLAISAHKFFVKRIDSITNTVHPVTTRRLANASASYLLHLLC